MDNSHKFVDEAAFQEVLLSGLGHRNWALKQYGNFDTQRLEISKKTFERQYCSWACTSQDTQSLDEHSECPKIPQAFKDIFSYTFKVMKLKSVRQNLQSWKRSFSKFCKLSEEIIRKTEELEREYFSSKCCQFFAKWLFLHEHFPSSSARFKKLKKELMMEVETQKDFAPPFRRIKSLQNKIKLSCFTELPKEYFCEQSGMVDLDSEVLRQLDSVRKQLKKIYVTPNVQNQLNTISNLPNLNFLQIHLGDQIYHYFVRNRKYLLNDPLKSQSLKYLHIIAFNMCYPQIQFIQSIVSSFPNLIELKLTYMPAEGIRDFTFFIQYQIFKNAKLLQQIQSLKVCCYQVSDLKKYLQYILEKLPGFDSFVEKKQKTATWTKSYKSKKNFDAKQIIKNYSILRYSSVLLAWYPKKVLLRRTIKNMLINILN